MKRTTYQVPELRDENDNIIQQGTYGKESPLVNSTNDGVLDYINNNLMYLYDNTMGGTGGEINTETITGKTGTITTLTATTVKAGTVTADALNGPLTGNVTGDLNGNVTGNLTGNVTGNVTGDVTGDVTGVASGNLPLTGGTVTGNLTVSGTITGDLTGDVTGNADTATNATNDANGNPIAGTYLPLSGGTMSGAIHFNGANNRSFGFDLTNNNTNMDIGWNWENRDGAGFGLRSTDVTGNIPGSFYIYARDGSNSTSLNGYPDGRLTWNEQPLLPVGIVQAFAGTTIPSGWLLCDGSAVSRTTYANLYACIGTTYGAGNGSTTFNLPNLVDKFIEGSATAGTEIEAGLPDIQGGFILHGAEHANIISATSGAITLEQKHNSYRTPVQLTEIPDATSGGAITFRASSYNSIYGNSDTVQPPAVTMRYIIKY